MYDSSFVHAVVENETDRKAPQLSFNAAQLIVCWNTVQCESKKSPPPPKGS